MGRVSYLLHSNTAAPLCSAQLCSGAGSRPLARIRRGPRRTSDQPHVASRPPAAIGLPRRRINAHAHAPCDAGLPPDRHGLCMRPARRLLGIEWRIDGANEWDCSGLLRLDLQASIHAGHVSVVQRPASRGSEQRTYIRTYCTGASSRPACGRDLPRSRTLAGRQPSTVHAYSTCRSGTQCLRSMHPAPARALHVAAVHSVHTHVSVWYVHTRSTAGLGGLPDEFARQISAE